MQQAIVDDLVNDASVEDDPIIAPLMREQLEALLGGRRDGGRGAPERALMRAMLQDAVLCLLGEASPAKDRARLADDAHRWVVSCSRAWIFSFESVCDALDIDSDYTRRHLLQLADGHRPANAARRQDGYALRALRKVGSRRRRAIHFATEQRLGGRRVAQG